MTPEETMAVQVTEATTLPPTNIEVTAETPDEMAQCQSALIEWFKKKVQSVRSEAEELRLAYSIAVQRKWRSSTLLRHAERAEARLSFYSRILTALEHGYQIVPSFPITAFAIRTDRNRPLKMLDTAHYTTKEQQPSSLPEGEGQYKNPFPSIYERTIQERTPEKSGITQYWAEAWRDLEFPVTMAKPVIMEATTRAMALKIFDSIGICPQSKRNADPMIIATISMPKYGYGDRKTISFIVAWHINTKDL